MSDDLFLSSVRKLTEDSLSMVELIGVADSLRAAGRMDLVLQIYKLWIKFNEAHPQAFVAQYNYAGLLADAGDLAGARAVLEAVVEKLPHFAPAQINLGNVLERQGAVGEAVGQWSGVVAKLASITPTAIQHKLVALRQIARVLEAAHLSLDAENVLRQGVELDRHQLDVGQHYIQVRLKQCKWPVVEPWEGVDRAALNRLMGPLASAAYTDDAMMQLAVAWKYAKDFIRYPDRDLEPVRPFAAHAARQGRRRIGYVSSDLRRHAVGYVMAELFDHHDASEFEIFVYYCGIPVVQDPIQDRIKAAVEHWVDVRAMDDETFAQRCYDDGIDILIDVNGYTMDAKTKAFALRPAPIIVNWLGYPGTMGSPYHHYIIADDWLIPKGSEVYYSEKVLRLPCYQPNDRKRAAAATPSRTEAGLPETGFVFCSFNNIHKIAAPTFDRWMSILSRVPGSVIWLLGSTEDTHNRLRDRARLRGVDPDRLIFRPTLPNADHIARYPLADLLLDTAPYGAHVTASDALWMGLPILTFSGHSFAARVCGSLVRSAGLGEMVCSTPEEFVERAVALANAPDELRRLKEKLAANRDTCVLFDIANLTRHLEGLFRDMWKDFMEGKTPRPDFTNMETYLDIGAEHDHDAQEVQAIRDLQGLYKRTLEARHRYAAIAPDTRLWTEDDIKAAERHS